MITGSIVLLMKHIYQTGTKGIMTVERPPILLLSIPIAENDTNNALISLTKPGVTLQPGQRPWERNTRLSVITRHILKDHLSENHEPH